MSAFGFGRRLRCLAMRASICSHSLRTAGPASKAPARPPGDGSSVRVGEIQLSGGSANV